jgi:dTDP-glucose 4,6-dehydratase
MSPTSHFAAEKAAADMLIHSSHKSHNSDVVITHACNVIGSYQHPNELIPYMITNSLDGKPVVLWEDGLQQRQLLYVQDYVTAMKLIVFKGEAGLVYNIGSQYEVTNLGIANSILGITRQTGLPIHYSNPPFVYDRRHALDFDALRDLGWKAIYSLEESLQQTVQWYRENRSWWASIKVQGKVL